MTFRVKAMLVVLACIVLFALNASWLLWLSRGDHIQEFRSLPWYQGYITYRELLLSPIILLGFSLFVILALARVYKLRSDPEKERQRLQLLALVCGTVLGLVLTAVFRF